MEVREENPVQPSEPFKKATASEIGVRTVEPGLTVYLGTTGTGKTTQAIADFEDLHKRTKVPAIVIDSAGVQQVEHLREVSSLREAGEAVWKDKALVRWTPESVEEFDLFIQAAREVGGIAILIDEISFWKKSTKLMLLCRVWRHSRVTLLITAQHVGADLAQVMLACNPRLYLYRITAPRSLEWVMKWHGLDPEVIRNQVVGAFQEKRL